MTDQFNHIVDKHMSRFDANVNRILDEHKARFEADVDRIFKEHTERMRLLWILLYIILVLGIGSAMLTLFFMSW